MKNKKEIIGAEKQEKIRRLNRKQMDRIRSAIIMCLVCVLMMSGATYAWFTISNSARVNQMKLSVASEGHLYIGLNENKVEESEVNFQNMEGIVLYPATTDDGINFKKPVYSADNVVSGVQDLTQTEKEKHLYYYEQTVYLKVVETLPQGASANDYYITLDNNAGGNGTYVKTAQEGTNPERCIRISFQKGSETTAAVYEPNADAHNTGNPGTNYATSSLTSSLTTHKQSAAGDMNFTPLDASTRFYGGDSSALFTITGGQVTPVTIRVWFEGTDTDCMNEVEAKSIVGQLKFVSHKKIS